MQIGCLNSSSLASVYDSPARQVVLDDQTGTDPRLGAMTSTKKPPTLVKATKSRTFKLFF
jgi:hypothetical protein